MTEGPGTEVGTGSSKQDRARSRRTLVSLAVFVGTFAVFFAGAVLLKNPDLRRRLQALVGPAPSLPARLPETQGAVRLELEVAPTGSLSLAFKNGTDLPLSLAMPSLDRTGPEIDVIVKDARGAVVAPTRIVLESRGGSIVVIPPGQTFRQSLRLEEYVALPPGRYEVHVERAVLRPGEPRLVSNTVVIEKK